MAEVRGTLGPPFRGKGGAEGEKSARPHGPSLPPSLLDLLGRVCTRAHTEV